MIKGNEQDCICEKPNGKHRCNCDAYRLSQFMIKTASVKNNHTLQDKISAIEERFDNDPDTGRAFLAIARGLAQLHGTDENEEKTPIRHREMIKSFYRTAILELLTEFAEGIIPKKKEIGDKTHCETCGGHIAAGECDCIGYNQCLSDIKNKVKDILG